MKYYGNGRRSQFIFLIYYHQNEFLKFTCDVCRLWQRPLNTLFYILFLLTVEDVLFKAGEVAPWRKCVSQHVLQRGSAMWLCSGHRMSPEVKAPLPKCLPWECARLPSTIPPFRCEELRLHGWARAAAWDREAAALSLQVSCRKEETQHVSLPLWTAQLTSTNWTSVTRERET